MRIGDVAPTIVALLVGGATHLSAQTYVSIDVPLNLPQVSSDIEQVRVSCAISGDGLSPLAQQQSGMTVGSTSRLPVTAAQQRGWTVGGQLVGALWGHGPS